MTGGRRPSVWQLDRGGASVLAAGERRLAETERVRLRSGLGKGDPNDSVVDRAGLRDEFRRDRLSLDTGAAAR